MLKFIDHILTMKEMSSSAELIITVAFLIAFSIATYTDIKERKIPLPVFPITAVFSIIVKIFDGSFNIVLTAVSFILFFIIFLLFALFGKGGGGDAIMMSCVGAVFFIPDTVWFVIAGTSFYFFYAVIYQLIKRGGLKAFMRMQLPYAPFIALGFAICRGVDYLL